MLVRFLRDKHSHKTGEEVELDQTLGSALVCAGVVEVVSFDTPAPDAPKAVIKKKSKRKTKE